LVGLEVATARSDVDVFVIGEELTPVHLSDVSDRVVAVSIPIGCSNPIELAVLVRTSSLRKGNLIILPGFDEVGTSHIEGG
jgi:hypothetical protein